MNSAEKPFALEQEDCCAVHGTVTPIVRQCGTCKFFEWERGPTGRKRPSQPGYCRWRAPWPEKWPPCFRDKWLHGSPRHPTPVQVYDPSGTDCECYVPND
jgi:hypothetical protein